MKILVRDVGFCEHRVGQFFVMNRRHENIFVCGSDPEAQFHHTLHTRARGTPPGGPAEPHLTARPKREIWPVRPMPMESRGQSFFLPKILLLSKKRLKSS